ncbi:hypothetical protein GCM10027035_29200 [Emticicia sediminis]
MRQAYAFEQFFQLNAFYNNDIVAASDITNTALQNDVIMKQRFCY